jgi:succinate dehydrogenase flavin-adding protein (antitoxin of CptAB toxin-antitoxin module)
VVTSEGGVTEVELRRLRWHCRRGLLELDLALTKFLERHARALQPADLVILNELLELGDNELWDLVSGRTACEVKHQLEMLRKLQEN